MKNLAQIKYTTENYDTLQGLKWTPFAVWCISLALIQAGYLPWISKWQPISGFIGIVIFLFAWSAANNHYKNKYGMAKKSGAQRKREIKEIAVFLLIFVAAMFIDNLQALPIGLIALVAGGMFVYTYFQSGRLRKHMLWLAPFFLPLVFLPMFDESIGLMADSGAIFLFVFGIIWLASALFDHWLLTKLMPPMEEAA